MPTISMILIRHATAAPAQGGPDAERHLTEGGLVQAERLGQWLKDNDLVPDAVICSPATRTRETWAQIVEATRNGVAIDFAPQVYEARPEDLIQVLREFPGPATRLALVGHSPGVPTLAYQLDDGSAASEALRSELSRGFAPASVAVVELDVPLTDLAAGTGRLTALLDGDSLHEWPH